MGLKVVFIIQKLIVGCPLLNELKSMEIWSGHSEMSVISQVSVIKLGVSVKQGFTVILL